MTTAIVDADKVSRKGRNKHTADSYVTDTHKKCSWCNEIKEHSEFHKCRTHIHGKGLAYYCKVCANEKSRKHTQQYSTSLEYKEKKKRSYIKNRFKLSLEEYNDLLIQQNNLCKICNTNLPSSGHLTHLDHNHITGKIRGFLCTNCNRGLGHFQDSVLNLEKAIIYLKDTE